MAAARTRRRARDGAPPFLPAFLKLRQAAHHVSSYHGWEVRPADAAELARAFERATRTRALGTALALAHITPEGWPGLWLSHEALRMTKTTPAVGYVLAERVVALPHRVPTAGVVLLVALGGRVSYVAAA